MARYCIAILDPWYCIAIVLLDKKLVLFMIATKQPWKGNKASWSEITHKSSNLQSTFSIKCYKSAHRSLTKNYCKDSIKTGFALNMEPLLRSFPNIGLQIYKFFIQSVYNLQGFRPENLFTNLQE